MSALLVWGRSEAQSPHPPRAKSLADPSLGSRRFPEQSASCNFVSARVCDLQASIHDSVGVVAVPKLASAAESRTRIAVSKSSSTTFVLQRGEDLKAGPGLGLSGLVWQK